MKEEIVVRSFRIYNIINALDGSGNNFTYEDGDSDEEEEEEKYNACE